MIHSAAATRLGLGLAIGAVAVGLAAALQPVAGQGAFIICALAVVVAVATTGVGAAVVAALAGALGAVLVVFEPRGSLRIDEGEDVWRLGLLVAVDALVIALGWALRRARDRAATAEVRQDEATAVLDSVFAQSALGLALWDAALRPVRVNPALTASGHAQDELLAQARGVLERGEPVTGWTLPGDGSTDMRVDLFPVRGRDGVVLGVAAAASDVSELARAERELRASRDKLALALDAARMGAWDWDVATGRLDWSGDLEAIHGMAPGSFAGTFASFMEAVHPEDREGLKAAIDEALERRGRFEVEFRVVAGDGGVRWVGGEGRVLVDESGRPARMIGIGQDVTDRRRVEASLRESEERFRMMADSAPVLIWVSDAAGRATYLNAEWTRFTGRAVEREVGDGWMEAVHPDDRAGWRAAFAEAAAAAHPFEAECRLRRADGEYRWVLTRGVPRRSGSGSFEGHVGSAIDIHDRREAQERERLLLEIGVVIERPLGTDERLRELVRALLPATADCCVVNLLEPDGSLRRVAVAHVDPQAEALIASLPDPVPDSAIGRVAAQGTPMLLPEVADEELERSCEDPAELERRRSLAVRSAVIVPLVSRGARIGVLSLSTGRAHSGRVFGEDDLRFARAVARRAALAIDNARLLESEQASAERLRFLAEASRLLGGSLHVNATLGDLARLIVPFLGDWCAVELVESGRLRTVATAHADPQLRRLAEDLRERYPPRPDERIGARAVIRTGEAQVVERIDDAMLAEHARDEEHLALLRRLGLRSLICLPLVARGRVLGALSVGYAQSGRAYDRGQLDLARELAQRAAVAIDNAALYRAQHHIAETLQRALLPPELPEIPGAAAAARYLPMGEGVDAGGDFYDMFELGGGRWLVVVGDVCGKGPEAASLTALARYTLRALAPQQQDPAGLLSALNDAVLRQRPGNTQFLTACAAAVERAGGGLRLEVACAGHPPPLVLRGGGAQEWVGARGGVVGVFPTIRLEPATVALGPGDRIVAYTDGVTEARAGTELLGPEGLARVTAEPSDGPDELAGRVADAVLRFQGGRLLDDLAVLVIEALPAETPAAVRTAAG